jgi:hypothetical protein
MMDIEQVVSSRREGSATPPRADIIMPNALHHQIMSDPLSAGGGHRARRG